MNPLRWAIEAFGPADDGAQAFKWWEQVNTEPAPADAPMPWAFFTMKTGVPGSGKSLTLVDEMRRACACETPPTIYVHNIPNLALPHLPLPVFNPLLQVKGDDGKPQMVFSRTLEVAWNEVVAGSLVVIDEAQHVFPVRSSAGRVPGYVSFLNTHRHKPVLIVVITQHPKLIDQAVRKLISKHQHYRRIFGGQRHVCYEWDSCSENLSGMKEATKRVASFPKKAFLAYKSAEAHTKPKFNLPVWLVVPVAAVIAGVMVAPSAWRAMHGITTGQGVVGKVQPAKPGESASPGAVPPGPNAKYAPGRAYPPGLSASVPLPVPVAVPADAGPGQSWPASIAGCWVGDTCSCMTNEPRPRILTGLGKMCVQIARGELVVDPARPRPTPAVLRDQGSPRSGEHQPIPGADVQPSAPPA